MFGDFMDLTNKMQHDSSRKTSNEPFAPQVVAVSDGLCGFLPALTASEARMANIKHFS